MPKAIIEQLRSGGQYRGFLIMCGLQTPHDPHLHGRVETGRLPAMDRICPGDGEVFDMNLKPHPQGGLFSIEPIPNMPIAFTYISPDDEQEFLADLDDECQLRAEERRPRRRGRKAAPRQDAAK